MSMNVLARTLGQSAFRRTATRTLLSARTPVIQRPAPWATLAARGAASQVSAKPGSQTAAHAAQNIKEEVGDAAHDLAKSISGANMTNDAVSSGDSSFVSLRRILENEHSGLIRPRSSV
jgi:hypothetical protein